MKLFANCITHYYALVNDELNNFAFLLQSNQVET